MTTINDTRPPHYEGIAAHRFVFPLVREVAGAHGAVGSEPSSTAASMSPAGRPVSPARGAAGRRTVACGASPARRGTDSIPSARLDDLEAHCNGSA
jgi:hypothetical protein